MSGQGNWGYGSREEILPAETWGCQGSQVVAFHIMQLADLPGELERSPYHMGQLPVVIYFWNPHQLLPPFRHIECLPQLGDPPFVFFHWGFWGGITSTSFPQTAGWLLEKAINIQCQLWWWPRSHSRKSGSAPLSSKAPGSPREGYAQENG